MLEQIQVWMQEQGIGGKWAEGLSVLTALALILLVSFVIAWIARRLILSSVHSIIRRSENKWDDILVEKNVFAWLAHLAPALVIYWGVQWIFVQQDSLVVVIQKLALIYMILVGFLTAGSLLNALLEAYERTPVSRRRPIKGYVQLTKIGMAILCGIFVVSTLLDRSPWGLLSLLGGLTAILLLVFKDTILGFVASVQLVSHDMVAKGDWISMPKYGADGDVLDISIHTVKVQNWDKTISTIPTYALINDSFTNWRGMTESGGRRIKRSLCIDMNSVRFCDDEMLERFSRIDCLKDYIRTKKEELDRYHAEYGIDTAVAANARRMTNLGTFRTYLSEYLKRHPKIHKEMTFLVRYLAPTPDGLPLEIYVFSSDQRWAYYEALQADIFDHVLAILPEFGLRVFQHPTGGDFQQISGTAHTSAHVVGT